MAETGAPRAKPTIKDVARLADASASTVSAVLSGTWEARRISPATAERIRDAARGAGFSVNRQARALRRGRSDMVGLLLPMHDNRFFAATAQAFESEARRRGLCPVVVSTLRDPGEEVRTTERLVSYGLDALLVAGATDPGAVGAVCRAAGVEHVYLDLPGPDAPSVVSDNYEGARLLTDALLDRMATGSGPRGRPHFLGGSAGDAATSRRIAGFRAAIEARGGQVAEDQVVACGYLPSRARAEIDALRDRLGGLPAALVVNSIPVFRGALGTLTALPAEELAACAIGCYDHDPIAAFLPFEVHMVRQDSERLVARAFAILDAPGAGRGAAVEEVRPELLAPRSVHAGPLDDLG